MANHPNRQQRNNGDHPPPAKTGTALEVLDFGDLAGFGTEGLGIDDQPTPLLRILHYQCPQTTRGDPKYIHGAEPGMICNVSIGEVWEGQEVGVDMIVCGTKRRYQEWIPRPRPGLSINRVRSGNFRGFHETDDSVVKRLLSQHGKFTALPWTNADNETVNLVETGELFVMFASPPLTHENAQLAMVNFQSTSLGEWKKYNGRHESFRFPQPDGRMMQAPLCFWRWRLRSQPASNDQGKFFIWRIDLASKIKNPDSGALDNQVAVQDPELFKMAESIMRQYKAGQVQEYRPDDDDQGDGPTKDPEAIPF